MKTRLIIAASMLLTSASFAQTTAETKQNAKATAAIQAHKPAVTGKAAGEVNSKATVKAQEAGTVAQENTVAVVEKVKHEKKEKKELVVDKAAKEKAAAQSVVSQDADVAAHSSSRATVKVNQGNNQTEQDASVNTGTEVAVNHGQLVKQENHGAAVRVAAATAQTTHGVKAVAVKSHDKVHASGSTAVKTAKKVKPAKISPASVRATTRANVNSGIRIN
ncbi:MAG: hypothetical protein Q7T76_16900 [Ferruginibacter sp.]|nr:hypothetical protein [Ferruginibacter sp.]